MQSFQVINSKVYLLLFLLLFSCKSDTVRFTGKVHMIGNEPFTQLAVISNGKQFLFSAKAKKSYFKFQGKTVRFVGIIKKSDLYSPNGSFQRTLYSISTIDSLVVLD